MIKINKTRKIIFLSILTTISLIISIFENSMSLPIISPGAKLGLSNIIILTTLLAFGLKDTLIVVMLKCIILTIIVGNPISLIYSVFSGIMSTIVMYLVNKYFNNLFSEIGVSVLGAITHNISQTFVAVIMLSNVRIFVYLPILSLTSIFTGVFVGISAIFTFTTLSKYINH